MTMKFLMTYQQNPDAPPPTPETMAAIGALSERNVKAGVIVMTGGLVRPTRGVQIRCERGKVSVTDGPFAETKEWLGGYYVIEAADLDAALDHASRIPNAGYGHVEVRPVMQVPGM
jgi:hypothetical protein